jgi:hypothetical protein
VVVFLNITFEDSGSSGFVEAGGLENVCCVDPVVAPSSHYMFFEVCAELELIHGYLGNGVSLHVYPVCAVLDEMRR